MKSVATQIHRNIRLDVGHLIWKSITVIDKWGKVQSHITVNSFAKFIKEDLYEIRRV